MGKVKCGFDQTLGLAAILAVALMAQTAWTENGAPWFRGQLHTHTYWSDGRGFPEQAIIACKQRGYDFLCLSDHNRDIQPRGKKRPARSIPVYADDIGRTVKTVADVEASYKLEDDDLYVRARVESDRPPQTSPHFHPKVKMAWTQPYARQGVSWEKTIETKPNTTTGSK